MNNLINSLLLPSLSMICSGTIAFYFKTNCYFGSLQSLSLWFMHKSLFINCVFWNHMQDISPWPGVQMKVSHFKRQVASHLAHGPERQPLYFINSLGVRHCPLISRLGRQPDSKWKHITAHLHVSWSAMTRVNVMGILVSKCISRYLAPHPRLPLCPAFFFEAGHEWQEFISAFSCENPHSCQMQAGGMNEIVGGYLRLISLVFKRSLMYDLKTKYA